MLGPQKVDKKNLRYLYNSERGYLYSRKTGKQKAFDLCTDTYEDLYSDLKAGKIEIIWLEGPPKDKVDTKD